MKKEPIICYEYKKAGHIKVDCPKLRKDKKSSKEKFEKFKKALQLGKKVMPTHSMMNQVTKRWPTCVLLPKMIQMRYISNLTLSMIYKMIIIIYIRSL